MPALRVTPVTAKTLAANNYVPRVTVANTTSAEDKSICSYFAVAGDISNLSRSGV